MFHQEPSSFGNHPLSSALNTLSTQGGLNSIHTLSVHKPSLLAAKIPTNTFSVTNTNDSGSGSLRQAIVSANADSTKNPKTIENITFNLGTGKHTIALNSALNITAKNLCIKCTGSTLLTVSGGSKVQDFTIAATANATISGLKIANGFSTGNGGGIYNNGTLTLNNSILSNDNSTGGSGGGIFNNGTLTANGDSFAGDNALNGAGGALFNVGTATITNGFFIGNSAANGGAIESSGTLSISSSSFTTNTGTGGFGGAIADVGTSKLTVTGSSFTGNSATTGGFGGAILNNNASTLTVTNSSFTNNMAAFGAAIFNDNSHGATATALGLTFSGNVSPGSNGTPTNNNDTFGSFTATVDTLQDTNDGNFSAGHLSLRNAINGGISGETINFAPTLAAGTIVLTQGELGITKSLSIAGLGATQLTIDANHQSRDFNVAAGTNVSISGLNIKNGFSGNNNFGGGIYSMGTLALSADIIESNTAVLGGGGMFNNMGTLTLTASSVSGNSGGNGGGLENVGGTATVINSVFTMNTSPNGLGGGISNSGTLSVSGTVFSQNTAVLGGGALFNNGTATIANSAFNNNSTPGKGGAIYNGAIPGTGSVAVTGSTFVSNIATQATGVAGDTQDVFGAVTIQ